MPNKKTANPVQNITLFKKINSALTPVQPINIQYTTASNVANAFPQSTAVFPDTPDTQKINGDQEESKKAFLSPINKGAQLHNIQKNKPLETSLEDLLKKEDLNKSQSSINDSVILNMTVIEELQQITEISKKNTLENAVKLYEETALNHLRNMKLAVSKNDYHRLSSLAHALKSSSGTIGARIVYKTATDIENKININEVDSVPLLIVKLEKHLYLALQMLRGLNTNSASNKLPKVGSGQYLLIVDDDPTTLDVLKTAMIQFGYKVDTVESGEHALDLIAQQSYDLIITDLQMPGMDGYGLCDAVRMTYSAETLPILVLTNLADNVQVKHAYETGISNFIVKPVNYLNLAYTILFTLQNTRNTKALWHHQQLLEAAEHTAQVSYWSWDIKKQQIQFSPHLQRYFSQPLENIISLRDFICAVNNDDMNNAISSCLSDGHETSWEQEITLASTNEKRFLLHRLRLVHSDNTPPVLIGTVQEISSIRNAEKRIMELAYYDSLTKLSSRSSFNNQLQNLIISSRRNAEQFAVLYLDLDEFKNINDSFGHDVGDTLLVEVANRLRHLLRESDFASRLGGDEFCLLISNIQDNLFAANIAQRCLELLAKPLTIAGTKITPQASIGIAIYPHDGTTKSSLIKAADTAMYEAKQLGKKQFAFYEPAMTHAVQHRLVIEASLRTALKENQFELYYQPKVTLATNKIHSVEALIRWNHPQKQLLVPNEFIPDAERIGLINEIGLWVVQQACNQIKEWQAQGIENLSIAVNISSQHFEEPNFVQDISTIVKKADVSPSLIEIEITESTSRDPKIFLRTCEKLREYGFRTAIDDFGTGYSSLSVLKGAPVDVLKIDREFIRHLPDDAPSSVLIGTILGMSKALGLQVVAEGVETEEQLNAIATIGCHMAQGYYFSKAVPAKNIQKLLTQPF